MPNTPLLLICAIAFLSLVGCSTMKKDDKGAGISQGEMSDIDKRAKAYGSGGGDGSGISPLNDPKAGRLAKRVIYFDYDSSSLHPDDQATVEAHAGYLAQHPQVRVILEGHTDERGSREYNLALGEHRASSVRKQFMALGANGNQIQSTSMGEERPADDGHDEAAYSRNRRVEIHYQQL
jgi:peptidoglycan-associated lipoprotein